MNKNNGNIWAFWKKLFRFSKEYQIIIFVAVICAIGGSIFTIIGPDRLSGLTDYITENMMIGIDLTTVFEMAIVLVIFYVSSMILSLIQGFIMANVTQKISQKLRTSISHKINRLPMSYYNHTSIGDVLSRITNDVDTISQALNQSLGTLLSAISLFIGSLIMMVKTNLIMTISGVIAVMIGFLFILLIMGKSQKYFDYQQKHLGQLNGHIEEIYSGHLVVKAYNGEEKAKQTFQQYNHDLIESGYKAQCLSGLMMPLMTFIGNFGYVIVCIVGSLLVMNQTASLGTIVAFMMYIRFFTQPLSQIAQAMQTLQSASAAGERVFEFLEAQEMDNEDDKTQSLSHVRGDVQFQNVQFAYEQGHPIIKNFSAHAHSGQKIAIVGPTGAGKTTLVNLLMRFYELNHGSIYIDGISTQDVKREDVHSQFCMVLQDTWLFEGSIKENLIYCTPYVTDDKMIKACQAVGLDHFVKTLPEGYDTILNDSVNLSQGQKQQLTIARAMIADKPMLILDEATSSVDTRTEIIIQNAMDQLMKNRTSFVIAHRLSTIKNADLILVMNHGDIIEKGTHEELLKQNGFYADLYNSQFEQ